MLLFITVLIMGLVHAPTQECEKQLATILIYGVKDDPAQVDRICRTHVKFTDNGIPTKLLPPYPAVIFQGCYFRKVNLVVYNVGDWRTLNHELRHAKDYLCY